MGDDTLSRTSNARGHMWNVVADNMQRIAMEVNRDRVGGHNDGGNKFLEKMEQLTPTTWAPSLG